MLLNILLGASETINTNLKGSMKKKSPRGIAREYVIIINSIYTIYYILKRKKDPMIWAEIKQILILHYSYLYIKKYYLHYIDSIPFCKLVSYLLNTLYTTPITILSTVKERKKITTSPIGPLSIVVASVIAEVAVVFAKSVNGFIIVEIKEIEILQI